MHQLTSWVYFILYRAVADALRSMKGIAQDMGNELDRQNKQINRLNTKVQNQDDNFRPINQRIQRQLK